jgi:hypothetical protein
MSKLLTKVPPFKAPQVDQNYSKNITLLTHILHVPIINGGSVMTIIPITFVKIGCLPFNLA